jgi:hypothetical protein
MHERSAQHLLCLQLTIGTSAYGTTNIDIFDHDAPSMISEIVRYAIDKRNFLRGPLHFEATRS